MNKLHTINAEDLQNRTYEPTHFLVDELIPEGLHICLLYTSPSPRDS